MASQGLDSLLKGPSSEGFPSSLSGLLGGIGSQDPLPSLLGSDPANVLNAELGDLQPSQAPSLASLPVPSLPSLSGLSGGLGVLGGSTGNPLEQVLAMNAMLMNPTLGAMALASTLSAAHSTDPTATAPAPMVHVDALNSKHISGEPAQKHPSLLKPEHKNSKASRRGPMDDMRQLVRILVKIFPQSIQFLQMGEEGGGNRVSEPQIKEYLRRTLGTECPQPEWGLPQGWGDYIATLFSWGLGKLVSQDQAMKCARRQQGRSWEVVESEIGALGIYTYAWPLPLTMEGVRRVQANPPQPPRGSGFSGPWAKAMAEAAQAQTQQKRAAQASGGGDAEVEADVKRMPAKKQRLSGAASPSIPAPVPPAPQAHPTTLTQTEEAALLAESAHLSIIGCLQKAAAAQQEALRSLQAAHLKARITPADVHTAHVLSANTQTLQAAISAMQAGWVAAAPLLQAHGAPAPAAPAPSLVRSGASSSPDPPQPSTAQPAQPPAQIKPQPPSDSEETEDAEPGPSGRQGAAGGDGGAHAADAGGPGGKGSGSQQLRNSLFKQFESAGSAASTATGAVSTVEAAAAAAGAAGPSRPANPEAAAHIMALLSQLNGTNPEAVASFMAALQQQQQATGPTAGAAAGSVPVDVKTAIKST